MNCRCGGDQSLRWRLNAAGMKMWLRQCIMCGYITGTPQKKPVFDAEKLDEQAHLSACAAYRAEDAAANHAPKRPAVDYRSYLASGEWQIKRAQVMMRDGHTCQVCGDLASDVHHITYKNLGYEYLWELVSLCRECHLDQHPEKK